MTKMRRVCAEAGLGGLWILGEYRGLAPDHPRLLADQGSTRASPTAGRCRTARRRAKAVEVQTDIWQRRLALGTLPDIVTVSMGWDSGRGILPRPSGGSRPKTSRRLANSRSPRQRRRKAAWAGG
ncbi:MAG: hypothetical protein M5U09_05985 [Gammaproteobacteria bacterium]|nr:hypothetical protein [Gammaproteobacteria bacterium]